MIGLTGDRSRLKKFGHLIIRETYGFFFAKFTFVPN